MRFALVSPEIAPFVGGGIAPVTLASAQELAGPVDHHVDVFAPSHFRSQALRLRALGVPALRHPRIRWIWVDPFEGSLPWIYRWAQAIDERLRTTYADGDVPDVVEFQDYLGSGALALQAARRGDSPIAAATLAVRLHSSVEIIQAVDGFIPDDDQWPLVHAMERTALRLADTVLAPSSVVGEVYRGFYADEVAPYTPLWPPFLIEGVGRPTWRRVSSRDELHLAYVGRMQASKGLLPLAKAIASTDAEFSITLVGGDTNTGPGGTSMREAVLDLIGDDPRVRMFPQRERHQLATIVQSADAVIVPSPYECWGNVALEALAANRAVIGTRVGALQDMLIPDADGLGIGLDLQAGIAATIEHFAADPTPLRVLIAESRPLDHFRVLTDPVRFLNDYTALAGADRPRSADTGDALASAVDAARERFPEAATPGDDAASTSGAGLGARSGAADDAQGDDLTATARAATRAAGEARAAAAVARFPAGTIGS